MLELCASQVKPLTAVVNTPMIHSDFLSTQAPCQDGEVRLVEGKTDLKGQLEGRLEVCTGQRWGTVSSDGWTDNEAHVVCRDMGYDVITGNFFFQLGFKIYTVTL